MSGPVLYSTNVYLKLVIQAQFQGDLHYVWCSEYFDSRVASPYSLAGRIAPSSDPAAIYRRLKEEVEGADRHSYKIAEQKNSLKARAVEWAGDSKITDDQRDEIIYMVDNAVFQDWRPLIYVVPRAPIESRLQLVPMAKRASFGNEFIIPDLARTEFDIIEP